MPKGYVTAVFLWSIVAIPLVFAIFRVPRRWFLATSGAIGAAMLAAWLGFAAAGYRYSENLSDSLPGHIYVYKQGEPFTKGDLVAYHWSGGATYPAGTIFIKRVMGVPGDVVKVQGRDFWVGDQFIGTAKPASKKGMPLEAARAGAIAADEYFVATPHLDSLDSRYAVTGNVRRVLIIGRAHELF